MIQTGVQHRTRTCQKATEEPGDMADNAATVNATEEAIVNAMVAAQTMTGVDGHTSVALPHDQVQQILKRFNRLAGAAQQ